MKSCEASQKLQWQPTAAHKTWGSFQIHFSRPSWMRCSCCPSLPRMLVGTAGEHCVWQWTFEGWTGQEFCMSIILYIFRCFVISWRFPLLPATELETHMRSRHVCAVSIGCLHKGKQQPCSECLSYPSGHAMPPHDQHGFVWNYMKLWYPHKFDA